MNPAFIDAFLAWHLREGDALRARVAEVVLKGPTLGYGKNSVVLEVVSPTRAAAVVVWDSGEYEVTTFLQDDGWEPQVEVDTLADPDRVAGLLDRVGAAFVNP